MDVQFESQEKNTARKKLVFELTKQFATYQIDDLLPSLAEDIIWTLVGDKPIMGRDLFAHALKEMSGDKATRLDIFNIMEEGLVVAIHGKMHMENGNVYGFADFYTFKPTEQSIVQSITSYVTAIEQS